MGFDLSHPGEILFEEFLKPMNISQNKIGRDLGLQMDYDLDVAEDALSARIKKEVRQIAVA